MVNFKHGGEIGFKQIVWDRTDDKCL